MLCQFCFQFLLLLVLLLLLLLCVEVFFSLSSFSVHSLILRLILYVFRWCWLLSLVLLGCSSFLGDADVGVMHFDVSLERRAQAGTNTIELRIFNEVKHKQQKQLHRQQ